MEKELKEYEGTIVYLNSNKESKSEGVLPYIYVNRDSVIAVMKEDDNPFENNGLVQFDGKRVLIKGYDGRSNTFIITEIKESSSK